MMPGPNLGLIASQRAPRTSTSDRKIGLSHCIRNLDDTVRSAMRHSDPSVSILRTLLLLKKLLSMLNLFVQLPFAAVFGDCVERS